MSGAASTSRVLQEAEHWFARLNAADCSAAERLAFQRWRAAPEHAAAFAATEEMWRALGGLEERADFRALSQKVLADTGMGGQAPAPRRRLMFHVAAAVAVCCGAGGLVMYTMRNASPVYSTEPGERSTVTLADGSKVILNSATELQVRFDGERRQFILRQGEALFEAARDPVRPFAVTAGDGEVTALGTRFLVRHESRIVTVTLLEGSVALDRTQTAQHLRLAPGEQVRFEPGATILDRRTVDTGVVSSWSTGRLRFRYTPLAEALEEVNRYSAVQIHAADPALASIAISGTFEVGDGRSVVKALEGLFPIEATEARAGEILLRAR